jgi:hypothetical protein
MFLLASNTFSAHLGVIFSHFSSSVMSRQHKLKSQNHCILDVTDAETSGLGQSLRIKGIVLQLVFYESNVIFRVEVQ